LVFRRQAVLGGQHLLVDFQDGGSRVVQQVLDGGVDGAVLGQQLAHVLGAAAGSRLVGHGGHPLHQVLLEQAAQAHQHAGHGAVAADEVLHALGHRVLDHVQVDRIEHDHGILVHAQGRRGVDPVAVPARCAQLREYLGGVVAALAGDDDLAAFQFVDVGGVFQGSLVLRHLRRSAAGVRSGEEYRLDVGEITLFLHALHQDRTDHAAPTNQTYEFHFAFLWV